MKALCSILLTGFGLASGWAQGTVNFANSLTTLVLGAPNCPLPVGTIFKTALYYLPDTGSVPASYDFDARGVPLGAPTGFGPVPGIFMGGTRHALWGGGETAWFQVRVWQAAFGETFEQAIQAGSI